MKTINTSTLVLSVQELIKSSDFGTLMMLTQFGIAWPLHFQGTEQENLIEQGYRCPDEWTTPRENFEHMSEAEAENLIEERMNHEIEFHVEEHILNGLLEYVQEIDESLVNDEEFRKEFEANGFYPIHEQQKELIAKGFERIKLEQQKQ